MKILIVDDEPRICDTLSGLVRNAGYQAQTCSSGEQALDQIKDEIFDVVMLDVMLPGKDGLETLEEIRKIAPLSKVLMMSGHSDLSMAVKATKLGASNFFEKPLNPDQILMTLKSIDEQQALEKKVAQLKHLVEQDEVMLGEAPLMKELKKTIARTAPSEGRILIFGENGTGKELVARAIHRQSFRTNGPFVSLNCAALPRDLVESELFGYEKGAFTGAIRRKPGRFEQAEGGTLFLDEIGDMGLDTQAKLLRVLEENEALRLGGNKPYQFNVRIISATNKNLDEEISAGRFREDLFYRLNVIPIMVPPLRDRKTDIPLLARYFLQKICEKMGKALKQWGTGTEVLLKTYTWPGNVRELKNLVERIIIMCEGTVIQKADIERILGSESRLQNHNETIPSLGELSFKKLMEQYEKKILIKGFRDAEGNVSKMARQFKIDRANLHRKLKAHGIK
jgi:two-component system nitrogen regulation response regulator NtrX